MEKAYIQKVRKRVRWVSCIIANDRENESVVPPMLKPSSVEDWIDIDIDSKLTNSGPPIPKIPPSEPINWSRVLLPLLESCLLPKRCACCAGLTGELVMREF